MYGQSSARDILLLAAEDAFEFERWRDAGPVTADIDPEVKAAEIAEFEALGIPMPSELDSLRRELEHAPKVRDAIRHSSLALRRSGRASASSLVALGPQQLMPMGAGGMPWGWPMGMDPRLAAAALEPRVTARLAAEPRRGRSSRVAAAAEVDASVPEPVESFGNQPTRARTRKGEPVEAEVVDDDFDDELDDDDDDEFADERPQGRAARARRDGRRRVESRRARAARPRDEWDDDDDDDDRFESVVAARPAASDSKTTWILGGVSTVAVLGLLWFAVNANKKDDAGALAQQQQQQQQLQQQAAPVQPPPSNEVVGAVDPATGLPLGQALAPAVEPTPAPAPVQSSSGRRSSGVSAVRSSSAAPSTSAGVAAGGGVNPFAGYKAPDDPGALASKPAAATPPAGDGAATQPAAAPPPANGATEPAAAAGAAAGAAGAAATPAPGTEAKPAESPKPAEQPKPEEPQLTKSKMTPAIREAVIGKVGDLQACYQDAVVGKPDLAGQVLFTISLDQDGVVKKVEIARDEVKYGVAKCSAKKIQRWTLPSAGIPIIFDLPFDFKS